MLTEGKVHKATLGFGSGHEVMIGVDLDIDLDLVFNYRTGCGCRNLKYSSTCHNSIYNRTMIAFAFAV